MRNTQRTFDNRPTSRENARSIWRTRAIKTSRSASRKKTRIVVRFEFHDDTAKSVCIAGTFNDWDPKITPMLSTGRGQWIKELELSSGIYEYQYVVDGRWINDPRAVKSTPNPLGGRNSVLVVERQDTESGTMNFNRATRARTSPRKGVNHDR